MYLEYATVKGDIMMGWHEMYNFFEPSSHIPPKMKEEKNRASEVSQLVHGAMIYDNPIFVELLLYHCPEIYPTLFSPQNIGLMSVLYAFLLE